MKGRVSQLALANAIREKTGLPPTSKVYFDKKEMHHVNSFLDTVKKVVKGSKHEPGNNQEAS